jgi:hypothetical protein
MQVVLPEEALPATLKWTSHQGLTPLTKEQLRKLAGFELDLTDVWAGL